MASGKGGAGLWLRCALFNISIVAWTTLIALTLWPTILVSRDAMRWSGRRWARGVQALLARFVGLRHQVRGTQHLPAGPVVLAAKHQSAWDTLIWHVLLDDPAVVMKKELLSIPIYGWMCRKTRMIAVDRKAGTKALRTMLEDSRAALELGRPIVIFPQGTRTAPGASVKDVPYQPGVSALYRGLDVPVVPVALNSGLFWPRRRFMRRSGTIVLEFLEPIPPGLPRKDFDTLLKQRIETATAALEAEGSAKSGIKY